MTRSSHASGESEGLDFGVTVQRISGRSAAVGLIGLLAGLIGGLFGIGGGILMVPLIVFAWAREMQVAVGTSLAVMIPAALAGTIRHHGYGNVDFKLAAALAAGAIVGTFFMGAPLAEYLPGETLKKAFGVLMVVVGLKMTGLFDYVVALAR